MRKMDDPGNKFEWGLVDGKIKFHAAEKIIELVTDKKISIKIKKELLLINFSY